MAAEGIQNERSGSRPEISVIMGIYDCADTLGEAIDSVFRQTFTNWELIMCDDGSSDETCNVAEKYRSIYPDKIILIKNECNKGLNYTLNRCLKAAKGKIIARMDGDDICVPERFEKELAVLENEPEIAIVSSDMNYFDDTGIWGGVFLIRNIRRPAIFYMEAPFAMLPAWSEKKLLIRLTDIVKANICCG